MAYQKVEDYWTNIVEFTASTSNFLQLARKLHCSQKFENIRFPSPNFWSSFAHPHAFHPCCSHTTTTPPTSSYSYSYLTSITIVCVSICFCWQPQGDYSLILPFLQALFWTLTLHFYWNFFWY